MVDSVFKFESSYSSGPGPTAQLIMKKLTEGLQPTVARLRDDSAEHAGHVGVQNSESNETHFHVLLVSDKFEGLALIDKHRLVNELLDIELKSGQIHALQI